MIKYTLRCANEHEFEAWFNSSATFEEQRRDKLLRCPLCETSEVDKALMAPSVVTHKGRVRPQPHSDAADVPARSASSLSTDIAELGSYHPVSSDPVHAKIGDFLRQLRQHVEATTEDVGKRFAEEARKIHYEETEPRGIRGEATAQEVEDLQEEGVAVTPLPRLPDDHN